MPSPREAGSTEGEHLTGRRSALGTLVSILAGGWTLALTMLSGAFLSSPLRAARGPHEIALGDLTAFGPEFTAVKVRVVADDGWYERAEQKTVFVRVGATGVPEIVSATCTHLGCTVAWQAAQSSFFCPCHDGRFAADGRVLAGPPPAPLARLQAEVRDQTLYARLS